MPIPTLAIPVPCPLPSGIPINVNAAQQLHAMLLLYLDFLDLLPLAFPCREALYGNDWSSGRVLEEEHREEWEGVHDPELPDKVVEEFQDIIPPYIHVFEDVFSKALFDLLLESKQWDHAIELLPNSTPSSYKVYLLAPKEQDKLNAFLQENLDSSHIYPSKSPMASPSSLLH
ncbi:hypothetical protein E4T56_gene18258 [Termitomyces sp. T112]|nr:hypothetical protein E4T56_gene18258 [Termitomyces sp. T112]